MLSFDNQDLLTYRLRVGNYGDFLKNSTCTLIPQSSLIKTHKENSVRPISTCKVNVVSRLEDLGNEMSSAAFSPSLRDILRQQKPWWVLTKYSVASSSDKLAFSSSRGWLGQFAWTPHLVPFLAFPLRHTHHLPPWSLPFPATRQVGSSSLPSDAQPPECSIDWVPGFLEYCIQHLLFLSTCISASPLSFSFSSLSTPALDYSWFQVLKDFPCMSKSCILTLPTSSWE